MNCLTCHRKCKKYKLPFCKKCRDTKLRLYWVNEGDHYSTEINEVVYLITKIGDYFCGVRCVRDYSPIFQHKCSKQMAMANCQQDFLELSYRKLQRGI